MALIFLIKSAPADKTQLFLWLMVILLIPVLGPALFLTLGRK
ncbi:MAG: PLDc N-terminal domain-containing protein [Chitinophagaceae bacterium]|nr:PLDc N-terminal domain-containing protein [Chitinophagaceae bacterium]